MIPREYIEAMDDKGCYHSDILRDTAEDLNQHNLESCRFIFKIGRLIDAFHEHCLDRKGGYDETAFHFKNMANVMRKQFRCRNEFAKRVCYDLGEPDLDHEIDEDEDDFGVKSRKDIKVEYIQINGEVKGLLL